MISPGSPWVDQDLLADSEEWGINAAHSLTPILRRLKCIVCCQVAMSDIAGSSTSVGSAIGLEPNAALRHPVAIGRTAPVILAV